jgi:POT family proton-dependent oligopeptide transporter
MTTVAVADRPKHPRGLYVLFFTEAWERYSFYSLLSVLVLYMDESLRFTPDTVGQVYGGYIATVYFVPLLGGYLGDRWLGYNRTVIFGGILITIGHFILATETLATFYVALGLIAFGSGMLKPNISTMVGNLYRDQPQLKDTAYNIFYMGINIGGFLGPLGVAYFRANYGWSVALGSAGVAMAVALVIFVALNGWIAHAGHRPAAADNPSAEPDPPDAGQRIFALIVAFAIITVFWFGFYQNGYSFTLWARDNTDTTWSPEVFYASNGLFIILFTPPLVWFWSFLRRQNREPSTPAKLVIGMVITVTCFALMGLAGLAGGDTGKVSPAWLIGAYALISLAEICLSPMGLSLVARMAPPRVRGVMMGVWFLTISGGGYFAGYLGSRYVDMTHSAYYFMVAAIAGGAALLLAIALRWLKPIFTRALGA